MKNFSELLATDLHVDLALTAEPIGIPYVEIYINQTSLYQGQLLEPMTISQRLPLLLGFVVVVKLQNKIYSSDYETAVNLTRLSVDNFDLIPRWSHLARYTNDHDFTEPTSYIGFNGEWKFEVTKPFYQWRHEATGQGWLFHPVNEIL